MTKSKRKLREISKKGKLIYLLVLNNDVGNTHNTWHCQHSSLLLHRVSPLLEHRWHESDIYNQICCSSYMLQLWLLILCPGSHICSKSIGRNQQNIELWLNWLVELYKYFTLLNLSVGTMLKIIGSIVETFPNLTSGMYNAQTTCAQPELSVFFRAPSLLGHSSHFYIK